MNNCKECGHMSVKHQTKMSDQVPRCTELKNLILPYYRENVEGVWYAVPTGKVPSWCPLKGGFE